MKLSELDPHFLKILDARTYQFEGVPRAEAQGIQFLCPKCWEAAGRTAVGVHSILCWFEGVPADRQPGPGRWIPVGTGYDDLTLNAPTPTRSVLLLSGCRAHFHVTNGEVTFC